MLDKTWGLVTHYDLDACVSALFADKMYNPEKFVCGGYPKLEANIEKLLKAGCTHLVATDLSFPKEVFDYCCEQFEEVHIFDHHDSTLELLNNVPDNVTFFFDLNKSAARLTYEEWVKRGNRPTIAYSKLVAYTDIYDTWKPQSENFKHGYDLNILFWNYHMWSFLEAFDSGFREYSDAEQKIIDNFKEKRDDELATAAHYDVGNHSSLYVIKDASYINDFALQNPGKMTYHMLRADKGRMALSSRVPVQYNDSHMNMNTVLTDLECEIVESFGGHDHAIGVAFKKDAAEEDIFNYINEFAKRTENMHLI